MSGLDTDSVVSPTTDYDMQLGAALARSGLASLPVEGGWVLLRDALAIPGAVERLVDASLRDRHDPSSVAVAQQEEDGDAATREEWVDYVVRCGIALRIDDVVRAWPGCCADWGALRDLHATIETPSAERAAWLGHDGGGISVGAVDGRDVRVRTFLRHAAPAEEWLVAKDDLERAIERAWDVVDRFEAVARPLIDARLGGAWTLRSRERR